MPGRAMSPGSPSSPLGFARSTASWSRSGPGVGTPVPGASRLAGQWQAPAVPRARSRSAPGPERRQANRLAGRMAAKRHEPCQGQGAPLRACWVFWTHKSCLCAVQLRCNGSHRAMNNRSPTGINAVTARREFAGDHLVAHAFDERQRRGLAAASAGIRRAPCVSAASAMISGSMPADSPRPRPRCDSRRRSGAFLP